MKKKEEKMTKTKQTTKPADEIGLEFSIATTNPKMGCDGSNLLETARAAVTHLATLCKQNSKGRCTGVFAITKTLEDVGFQTSMPHFVLFLQQLGVVKKLGKSGMSLYKFMVIDPDFFDLMVSQESVDLALKQMAKRRKELASTLALRKQVEVLEKALQEERLKRSESTPGSLEQLAEVVALLEGCREELKASQVQAELLQKELHDRTSVDPSAVAAQLVARARGGI